ncbi:glutathione ABC transporter, periplasmic glutathione-binding GsiB domain protein [Escherichia coli DEC7D]|nr:glutathione ABC transporter, periplasmic glutathione-binding GsiB domain protein [Escherichia coli DEC7D]
MARAVHRSGLVALGIATALMASCAFAAKDVVVAVGSNFTTLDPYDANDTLSQAVAKSFYQGLFGLDKEMKLKNVLAESYTVSDDGITYTVKLREGIKFQDGTDFNAAAVKANLDRASDPANHLKRYNLYKNIAKTEAIDPTTVKITLKQPFSAFINILAHPATAMISPAALEKYGKEIGFHPVGTGRSDSRYPVHTVRFPPDENQSPAIFHRQRWKNMARRLVFIRWEPDRMNWIPGIRPIL